MTTKENFLKAITELKSQKSEAKFKQTLDLIINLKNFDIKRNSLSLVLTLPHKVRDRKVAGFLEKKSSLVATITKDMFDEFKDKKKMKKLVRGYDVFIASAKVMPAVATTFGRALGPSGKMPSPQLGVLMQENEDAIKAILKKIDYVVKIKTKEPSIKIGIGKQDSDDGEVAENAAFILDNAIKNLTRGKDNIKSVLIKYTMSKPVKVAL